MPADPKKKKPKKLTSLKDDAWALFSKIIRLRGSDENGFNTCVTCGVRKHWKKLQAGHFIDGRRGAVLFDPNGVWPQCFKCNFKSHGCLAGNKVKYTLWMQAKFGEDFVKEMVAKSHEQVIYTREDYAHMIRMFQDTLERMEEKQNARP